MRAFDLSSFISDYHRSFSIVHKNQGKIVTTSCKNLDPWSRILIKILETIFRQWLVCGMCMVWLCNSVPFTCLDTACYTIGLPFYQSHPKCVHLIYQVPYSLVYTAHFFSRRGISKVGGAPYIRVQQNPTFIFRSHGAECYRHSFPTRKTHPTFIFNVIRSQRLP